MRQIHSTARMIGFGLAVLAGLQLTAAAGDPDKKETHWAFQPIERPALPACPTRNGRATPSIASSWRRWRREGIKPVGEADRRTLIRRLYLDLIGLPPSPR